MRVFITGLNGFVAGHLATHLAKAGHEVSGSSRTPSGVPGARVWRLGAPVDDAMLRGVQVLIHCAHDFTKGAMRANVDGTLALADAARRAGVARQIYVSSLSARRDARSEYGRSKFEIEQGFLDRGDTVVRPGTVIGTGGVFGKMALMIERSAVLPLVDGGRVETTVIGLGDLGGAMEAILGRAQPREYNLYYPERPTIKRVLGLLRERLGRNTLFVPVPARALIIPLTVLAWLRIPTPIDLENLQGYIASKDPVHPSDLRLVVQSPGSLQTALAEAWPDRAASPG